MWGKAEADVVADGADVAQVIGDALALGEQRAQVQRARRHGQCAARSMAWQAAQVWPTVVSPETRPASRARSAGSRPTAIFSMPLCR
jgi:hypothetical protein